MNLEKNKILEDGIKRRYRKEKVFKSVGLLSIFAALIILILLFVSIFSEGYTAFWQTFIRLEIVFDQSSHGRRALSGE